MADPRIAAIQNAMGNRTGYKGMKKSPDLPSAADSRMLQGGGDQALMDFINQFGLARTETGGAPPSGIPLPRPRQPDMQPEVMGPVGLSPPAAELRVPQDLIRNFSEPNYERPVGDFQQRQYEKETGQGNDVPGDWQSESIPSDEKLLAGISDQIGKSKNDDDFTWEGEDAPTESDIDNLMGEQNVPGRSVATDSFIQHFGEDVYNQVMDKYGDYGKGGEFRGSRSASEVNDPENTDGDPTTRPMRR